MIFNIKHRQRTRIADTETPVSLYLAIRDSYSEALLFERSNNDGSKGLSIICFDPLSEYSLSGNRAQITYPDNKSVTLDLATSPEVIATLEAYMSGLRIELSHEAQEVNGLFGYFAYDAARHFNDPGSSPQTGCGKGIADIRPRLYRYHIVYHHDTAAISMHYFYTGEGDEDCFARLDEIVALRARPAIPFSVTGVEKSSISDDAYIDMVMQGKEHCYKGDIFQVVLSRPFMRPFTGDDFNVYRNLRAINPSRYLFYFDYSDYRLFGASPESQIRISGGQATLHPIAGTCRRNGNPEQERILAEKLLADDKEHSEHVMLVDLARNDLSKSFREVEVASFKKIQRFSHVLHIVSEVTGPKPVGTFSPLQVLAETFPAGTLSGAPKHRAMQIIAELEAAPRGFYGGCTGFIGLDQSCDLAITIRSILSKDNTLHYQAGAGIIANSVPEQELAEVNNKVSAIRAAIHKANTENA